MPQRGLLKLLLAAGSVRSLRRPPSHSEPEAGLAALASGYIIMIPSSLRTFPFKFKLCFILLERVVVSLAGLARARRRPFRTERFQVGIQRQSRVSAFFLKNSLTQLTPADLK